MLNYIVQNSPKGFYWFSDCRIRLGRAEDANCVPRPYHRSGLVGGIIFLQAPVLLRLSQSRLPGP